MVRQRKDIISEDDGSLFEAGPDELEAVLSGLPSEDSVISLWRLLPQGRPSYVAEFSPSDFSIEAVKNSFGGGSYKYVAKSNGNVVKTGSFAVEGEPKTGPASKPIYKRYVGNRLVYSKPEDAEVIVGGEPLPAKVSGDPVMMLLLTEIRAMREQMQTVRGDPMQAKKDFLEEMRLFKDLFVQPQQNPVGDFSKMAIDLIKQGMDVAAQAENGGSPWMMILDKVAPMVQDVLKMVNRQQAMTAAVPMPSEPINRTQPAQIPATEKQLSGFDAIAEDLKFYLPTFVRSASAGTDPAILVDMTLPNIPSSETAAVVAWLQSDNWFTDLCKLHPAISAQVNWWQGYRNELLTALTEPQDLNPNGHDGEIEQ